MKKKIKYIIIIIIFLLIIATIVFLISKKKESTKNVVNEEWFTIDEDVPKNELPEDNDFRDNKLLFGSWNSFKTEIYLDGKLTDTLVDTDRFNIVISSNDTIGICYINEYLKCYSMKYVYQNHMLYLESNYTYLNTNSEIIMSGKELIIKAFMNNEKTKYSLLYFKKAKNV